MLNRLPTIEDFIAVTTERAKKVHTAEADWTTRTLCGYSAMALPDPDMIHSHPTCKQCEKSRTRRIEGRPS
jgi:hypothetical protein